MAHAKYELRNSEVQEVMNRPPNALITWGNTIIFLTVIGGLLLLGLLRLPEKVSVPFQVSIRNEEMVLSTLGKVPSTVKKGQSVTLFLESYPATQYGTIMCSIDSIAQDYTTIFTNTPKTVTTHTGNVLMLANGQLGSAEIVIGKTNLFVMGKNRLFK